MGKEQYDKVRKGKYTWDPAKAKAWGEEQRRRNRERAARRAASGEVGSVGNPSSSGGPAGGGGPVASRPGDGNKSNNRGPGRGRFDDTDNPHPTGEEKVNEKPIIDLDAVFETLPDLLKLFVLGLDNWARLITGDPRIRVWVYYEPLTDREAKTLASFSRPYIEAHLGEFIRNHPGLAFALVPVFIVFFKTRVKVKKTTPGGPGPVVDAEWTEVPLQKEKAA